MPRLFHFVLGLSWLGLLLVCCDSRTVFDQRFADSQLLAAPVLSVSLPDPNNFTFAAVGDLHIGDKNTARFERILAAVAAEGDSFVAILGDIVDKGEREDVVAFRTSLSNAGYGSNVIPVIGNHDVFNNGWTPYKEFNGAATYTLTVGNTKFVVLDTADGGLGDAQRSWLEANLNKGSATNLIMLSHYLPLVPDFQTYLKIANQDEALGLMKLASSRGVLAWFGAHYHSYVEKSIEGVRYVVAGGGGGRRMDPVRDFFFLQVRVAGSDITIERRTVE